jgi:phosphatidate cytidylyltransferase
MMVVAIVTVVELFAMTHGEDKTSRVIGVLMLWGVVLSVYAWPHDSRWLLTTALLLPFCSVTLALWRLGSMPESALRVTAACFGPLWLGAGLGSISLLRTYPQGASYVILSLVIAWASDTGGYTTGRLFGKHKLYEAVSPKKTIEGAVGGLAAAVAGVLVMRAIVLHDIPLLHAVLLGLVAGVAGVLGDLGESLLKRSTGVKDSGGIVPGHGGLLDRIDAVVITAPITLLYLVWTGAVPLVNP